MRTCKLLLVDDHELIRVGMRTAYPQILGHPVEWVEAQTLDDALTAYRQHGDFDAVLLDLNLADCKGLQGLCRFLGAFPQARVAVFSGAHDEFVVRQARLLGAAAYVCKGMATQQLAATLGALIHAHAPSGHTPAPPPAGVLFPRAPASAMYDRVSELGTRHLEILDLVLSGCTNQEISGATSLSLGTVKNYVSSLLMALDVRSRSHLISLFR